MQSLENYVPPPKKKDQFKLGSALLSRKTLDPSKIKSSSKKETSKIVNEVSEIEKIRDENITEFKKAFKEKFGEEPPMACNDEKSTSKNKVCISNIRIHCVLSQS